MTGTRSRMSRCFALTSQSMRADGKARRSAAATGIAWTMSPSAPRRTMRIRCTRYAPGSGGLTTAAVTRPLGANAPDQVARRVRLRIADDRGPAPVRADDVAFGHRVEGVVRALAVNVRPDQRQQPLHGLIVEDDDVVDAADGRHELGAVGRRQDRPARPLEPAHRSIAVDGDDEPVGFAPRRPADSGRGPRAADRSSRSRTRSSGRRRGRGRPLRVVRVFGDDHGPSLGIGRRRFHSHAPALRRSLPATSSRVAVS